MRWMPGHFQRGGVAPAFLDGVFLYEFFVDSDSQARLAGYLDEPLLDFDLPFGQSLPPGIFRLIELQEGCVRGESEVGVGNQRQGLHRGGNHDVRTPTVRIATNPRQLRQFGNENDFADTTAQTGVRLDDVEGAAVDEGLGCFS